MSHNRIENGLSYVGSSMRPTLQDLDRLKIRKVPWDKIRVGDVVVFTAPSNSERVVHRVIGRSEGGLITRGDNMLGVDAYLTKPENLIGKVVKLNRSGRSQKVVGGMRGWLKGHASYNRARIRELGARGLRKLGGNAYLTTGLGRLAALHRFTEVVVLGTEGRTELFLMLWGKVIGRYRKESQEWRLNPFYALFIDKSKLPVGGAVPTGDQTGR